MTSIAQFTSPELIVPQLACQDTAGIIGELCSTLQRHGRVTDVLPFCSAVMNHEVMCSTATSPGWALPHARMKGLSQLSFAVGRSLPGVDWMGRRGERVQMIFLFAVPEDEAMNYMTLLSKLARLSQDAARAESLLKAPNSQAIFQILQ